VGEYLPPSESEGSLSGLEFGTDNELDDRALPELVVNDGSEENDNISPDLVWENMEDYKGQRENFMSSVGPQGTAKHMTETKNFLTVFQQETNRHDCQRNKLIC
jgi:cytochrome c556